MDNIKNRESMLTELNVEQLKPHPNNPRLDVGDVSELTESIRKNGIMQNLTVIPADETMKEFTVLIGHRRLAAAKAAGLKKVPCRIIFDMSDAEQVSMMLEENMQRNDLTIYEQAWGFQMMFDFGETVESIADKTGFNESTIYHRLNLAKLDRETLKGKVDDPDYQLNIKDLQLLERVKDVDARNQILKTSRNSSDIKWKVDQYTAELERKEYGDKFRSLFEDIGIRKATSEENNERWWHQRVTGFELNEKSYSKAEEWIPEAPSEYFYVMDNVYTTIYTIERDKTNEKTPEQKREEENRNKLNAKLGALKEKKQIFMETLLEQNLNAETERETEIKCLNIIMNDRYFDVQLNCLEDFGLETAEAIADAPRYMLWLIYVAGFRTETELYNWNSTYDSSIQDYFADEYKILSSLGLDLTEEEKQLLDGTHELYKQI